VSLFALFCWSHSANNTLLYVYNFSTPANAYCASVDLFTEIIESFCIEPVAASVAAAPRPGDAAFIMPANYVECHVRDSCSSPDEAKDGFFVLVLVALIYCPPAEDPCCPSHDSSCGSCCAFRSTQLLMRSIDCR
jgi:hypothetical protein